MSTDRLDYIEKKKNEKAKKSKDEEKAESLRKENVLLAFKGVSVDETDRSANRKIISEALNTLGFAVSNVYFCNTQENEEGKQSGYSPRHEPVEKDVVCPVEPLAMIE